MTFQTFRNSASKNFDLARGPFMGVPLVQSPFVSRLNFASAGRAIFAALAIVALSTQLGAQDISLGVDGTISTIAGPTNYAPPNLAGYKGDGGPANLAMLNNPTGIAFDAAGDLYIADYKNNVVRKVSTMGIISTVVGNNALGAGFSGDNGPATAAQLNQPSGLAFDKNGNLYIVDNGNSVVRKVNSSGTITTVAGNFSAGPGFSGDGGPAASAQLNLPLCIVFDAAGNFYISDTKNSVVRKVNTQGVISTVAGDFKLGAGYSGDSGLATSAQLNYPAGLTFDSTGNLYIADQNNNVVRIVSINGIITTFAGDGAGSYDGDGGPAISAGLSLPLSIAVDSSGNVYIADYANQVIRKVDSSGTITTIAGYRIGSSAAFSSTYGPCYPPDPFPEDEGDGGPASWACLGGPFGLTFDHNGNLYFADALNNSIREITMPSTSAAIFPPTKVGSSSSLNINVTNISPATYGISIPAITLKSSTADFSLSSPPTNGCPLTGNITLPLGGSCTLTATFKPALAGLRAVALSFQDPSNTFPFDTYSLQGVGVGPMAALDSGVIFTAAGNVGQGNGYSGDGGPAIQAQLSAPIDVATDSAGNLYIYGGNVVRKVDTHGFISTIAGGAAQICSAATDSIGDGCPATQASLCSSFAGIAADAAGNIYLTDCTMRVRKVTATTGVITTVAGVGGGGAGGYSGDGGPATSAELGFPDGLAVDTKGNLYIAEADNSDVRKVDTNGTITTVAGHNGNLGAGYSGDGGLATAASLLNPVSVKVDSLGNLYITDSGNFVIRKVNTSGIITTIAGVGGLQGYAGDGAVATSALLNWPTGIALDPAGDIYISDEGNEDIRKVDTSGIITTVAGSVAHICAHALDALGDGCLSTQANFGAAIPGVVPPPNGIAFDGSGDLFIADIVAGVVREVMPGSTMEFGPVPVTQSTTLTTFMFNTGNASLKLSSSSTFGISGSNSADFTAVAGASKGCALGATVAPGDYCTLAVTFTPSAAGGRNAQLAVSSNASNSASVTAALEGTGTTVSPTSITLANSSTTVLLGSTVTFTATVKPSSGSGTPTGSVNFYDGSTLIGTGQLNAAGVAIYGTSSLPTGANSITADYVGDPYFSSSTSSAQTINVGTAGFTLSNSGNISISPGATTGNTTTITIAPTFGFTGGVNLSCTITTTLTNPVSLPTCSISSPISLNGAIAPSVSETLTISTTPTTTFGTYTVAVTGTDAATGKIAASTPVTLIVHGFGLSNSGNLTVSPGATTGNSSTITVTPGGGFTGNVTLTAAVTSSPAGAQYPPTVSFGSTSPVSITSASAGTATLTISTTAATSAALSYPQPRNVPWYAAGGTLLAGLLLFGIPARRRSWRTMLGILLLLAALGGGMVACGGGGGGGGGGGTGSSGTTAGAYTVTVTGTSGSITQTTTLTVTVN
jgi:sugar lactone lactonase YvrE